VRNPYIKVHRKIARHRGVQWVRLVPVVAVSAAVPLVSDIWFGFLPREGAVPVEAYADALAAVVARLGNLVAAAVVLASYTALVRGPDRAVLDVHPVRPKALVWAIARSTSKAQMYLLAMAAVLLLPVALAGAWLAYCAALGLVVCAWLGALGVGFLVNLGAVWSAYSPAWAAALDALRGDNPPMQAALIYAPGVALLLIGSGVEFAAIGLAAGLKGWLPGFAWIGIPVALGAGAWAFVGPLAQRFYVRASLLLAEVDGAWAHAEEAEHASDVYLQRWASGRPEVLRALRNGWRAHRIYVTGVWALGLAVIVFVWSEPASGAFWGAGAVVWVTSVASRMPAGDPRWLDRALGVLLGLFVVARACVAFAYAMGIVGPVGLAMIWRHGSTGAAVAFGLLGLAIAGALSGAMAARLWRNQAVWAYLAFALVVWAGFVRVLG
jgi:hypothetical protein